MSPTDAERLLRLAVRDLADAPDADTWTTADLTGGPTGGVAGGAIRRGRWLRRRRQGAVALVAVGLVAAVVVPYRLLDASAAGPVQPVAPPSGTPTAATDGSQVPIVDAASGSWPAGPVVLADGWLVLGGNTAAGSTGTGGDPADPSDASGDDPAVVLDRSTGRYRDVAGHGQIWPAASSTLAAVGDENRPFEIGLLDLATDKLRWVATGQHILTPQWSPTGDQLLLTILDKQTSVFSIAIVDATTDAAAAVRSFPVDVDVAYRCTDRCMFTWSRDGREVALSQTDPAAPQSESRPHLRRGVQFFSAQDGTATRFLPVPGDVTGPWSWSPDGSQVVVQGQRGAQLVDAATGQVRADLPTSEVYWTAADRLLYLDRGTGMAVSITPQGRPLAGYRLPAELTGRDLFLVPG